MNVSDLILSRLDYYISVPYGLPRSTIAPLQRVQNAAAVHGSAGPSLPSVRQRSTDTSQ